MCTEFGLLKSICRQRCTFIYLFQIIYIYLPDTYMLSYFGRRSPTTSYYSYAVDSHCFFWSFIYIVCLTMDCLLQDAINHFVY